MVHLGTSPELSCSGSQEVVRQACGEEDPEVLPKPAHCEISRTTELGYFGTIDERVEVSVHGPLVGLVQ